MPACCSTTRSSATILPTATTTRIPTTGSPWSTAASPMRHAAHRIGDAAVDQGEPVVGMRVVVAVGKMVALERVVEQHAGIVAGERPAGAVGALHPRREADDQKARVDRAERGNRRVEPFRL